MAGLWSRWRGKDGDELWSCTVVVKDADDWYTKFHDRMAVLLPDAVHDEWIDPARTGGQMETIERGQYPKDKELEFYPISRLVNNPRNDSPECLERGTLYEDPQADLFAQT